MLEPTEAKIAIFGCLFLACEAALALWMMSVLDGVSVKGEVAMMKAKVETINRTTLR